MVGIGHAIYTLYLIYQYLTSIGKVVDTSKTIIDATKSKNKLGIIITGCDSGFGYNAAISLSKLGYTVFAGCYSEPGSYNSSENNFSKLNDMDNIIAFKMDVTDEKDVKFAFEKVSSWLAAADADDTRPKVLHGLINNAGTGALGFIDWNDLSAFRESMEVNYFAMIQVTKTFLPIFKSQACEGTYSNSRIINIVSVAGLVPLSGPYSGSKFAAEAFSNLLRQELKSFNISVVTMNPTFHKTPMADQIVSKFEEKFNNLSPDLKKQYGDELFNFEKKEVYMKAKEITWDAIHVTNAIVKSIALIEPSPQVIVGTDGKYFLMILRMLPIWFIDRFRPYCMAAGMKKTS